MSPVYASTVPDAVHRLQTCVDLWRRNAEDNVDLAIVGDIGLVLAELERTKSELRLTTEHLAAYRIIESGSLLDVAHKAVATWGVDAQLNMALEECGELIAVINRWRRGRVPAEEVAEEVADVIITLTQVEHMIGVDTTPFVAAKLERLKATIAEHEKRAKGGE